MSKESEEDYRRLMGFLYHWNGNGNKSANALIRKAFSSRRMDLENVHQDVG